jgi:peptidoglycan/LPS O-acetylase OafA/YrhL
MQWSARCCKKWAYFVGLMTMALAVCGMLIFMYANDRDNFQGMLLLALTALLVLFGVAACKLCKCYTRHAKLVFGAILISGFITATLFMMIHNHMYDQWWTYFDLLWFAFALICILVLGIPPERFSKATQTSFTEEEALDAEAAAEEVETDAGLVLVL